MGVKQISIFHKRIGAINVAEGWWSWTESNCCFKCLLDGNAFILDSVKRKID